MANEASGRTGQAGSLPELIDLLYDAATAPERWRHFLEAARSFADADVADLGELVPHLRRVLAIQDRLEHLDGRRRDTYAVLESLPTGILILAADGMIEFANAAARDLLDRCDGLSAEQGVLRAFRRSGLDLLEPVLREVMASGEHRAMAVERPSGRPAFRCLLSRLWRDVGDGLPNLLASPRIACYVTDPDRALEAPAELLQRLFGLTPGEARLVEAIVSGSSLAEAAESLGIRESTARDRLKGVFRKTATGSQTELVRTVLTSPVWLCGGGGRAAAADFGRLGETPARALVRRCA